MHKDWLQFRIRRVQIPPHKVALKASLKTVQQYYLHRKLQCRLLIF